MDTQAILKKLEKDGASGLTFFELAFINETQHATQDTLGLQGLMFDKIKARQEACKEFS